MKRFLAFLILALVFGLAAFGGYSWMTDRGRKTTHPVTTELAGAFIEGALHYPDKPSAVIRFDPAFSYLGGQKFELYGSADVEQHFFVEADAAGQLKSAVWIQFESVRSGIDWQYDYSGSPLRTAIGEFDFYTNTEAGVRHPVFELGLQGGDGYPARKFLKDLGFRLPKNFAYGRMVHLPTEDRRHEMIFIFIDDLGPTGFTGRDLQPGGAHEAAWPAISEAHLAKFERVTTITAGR